MEAMASSAGPEVPAAAPATVLSLKELGKKDDAPWVLAMHPGHLELAESAETRPYVLLRSEFMKSVILMETHGALVVQRPRKLTFKLTPSDRKALAAWIGEPFLASFYLKRHYSWLAPWAFLSVLGAFLPLLPSSGKAPSLTFDPMSLVLGLVMLAACAFARWRPHPLLFLVEAVWFSWAAINLTGSVAAGRHKAWILLVVLMVAVGGKAFQHFFRFRKIQLPPRA
jgi:hypothetical protein